MTDEDDDLFRRWSRRRRAVAEEETRAAEPAPAPELDAPEEPEPETPEDERLLLERLKLPLPESLKAGDDFSIFMRAGVPDFLRRRALRMLWRSNPLLANLDGLNDYDIDYRSPEMNAKVLATAYRVGQGFLKAAHVPEIMQENDAKIQTEALAEANVPHEPLEEPEISAATSTEIDEELIDGDENERISLNPKRMRFTT